MTATTDLTTQIYQVFIKASPEQIWAAITTPGYTARYFHGARIEVSADRYIFHGPDGATWGDGPCWNSIRPGGWCTNGALCTTPTWRRSSQAGSPGRSSRKRAASAS